MLVIGFLNDEIGLGEALEAALAAPFDNALLIAHLTTLRSGSTFVYARNESGLQGLMSLHTGLPLSIVAVWCQSPSLFRKMLGKMASRFPQLREEPLWCLGNRKILNLIERSASIDSAREELQMRLDWPSWDSQLSSGSPASISTLTPSEAPDLTALYDLVPPEAWRPEEIERGPYRGVYEDKLLVAAAGVHWISPWLAEIGNVSVHPSFRRRGLGEACVGAVIEELKTLTERVYLMVVADNAPALSLYRKMGFEAVQRMWLIQFRLRRSRCARLKGKLAAQVGSSAKAQREGAQIEE